MPRHTCLIATLLVLSASGLYTLTKGTTGMSFKMSYAMDFGDQKGGRELGVGRRQPAAARWSRAILGSGGEA